MTDDLEYAHRVDEPLNAHRLNVAMLGYGEEHDQTYTDTGVSSRSFHLTSTRGTWRQSR